MYSSQAYYADQGPPPPPRPSSGYDQYSASYPSQSYHGHPLSQSQSHSPRLPAQTHRPQGSRPVSFSGYSTAPQHRPPYQPAPHSFQQPIPHASPPAVAIHDYSRPGDTPGVAWPEPQRRRPSGGYDLTPPDLDGSFGRLSLVSIFTVAHLTASHRVRNCSHLRTPFVLTLVRIHQHRHRPHR